MTNYMFTGLSAFDLEIQYSGTNHFIYNLSSEWYKIDTVAIVNGEMVIKFIPSNTLPLQLCAVHEGYNIVVHPHKDFGFVVKHTEPHRTAYMVCYCKLDNLGDAFFHYDWMVRDETSENDCNIVIGTTTDSLEAEGFTCRFSCDNIKTEGETYIYNERRVS